jgi:arylsulfatase A-like enzyme
VLDFLKENGLDKNTVVVYTSDQGFYLGEHGLFDKRFMYEEALRTPMMIKYPDKIKKGTVSEHMVLNLDIAPTVLDVADVQIPADMQGVSLQNTWNGSKEWREAMYYHFYEKGWGVSPHYGVRTDRYKLIHFYDLIDSWELYDLKNDPNEMNNLIQHPEYEQIVKDLKNKLKELQTKYKDEEVL